MGATHRSPKAEGQAEGLRTEWERHPAHREAWYGIKYKIHFIANTIVYPKGIKILTFLKIILT